MAVYTTSTISVLTSCNYNRISIILMTSKFAVFDDAVTLMLLYHAHNTNLSTYIDNIPNLIPTNMVHTILGDFNVDVFNENNNRFHTILQDVEAIVTGPTHPGCSPLDQVYIHKSIIGNLEIRSCVEKIYLSDHERVGFSIQNIATRDKVILI